MTHKISRKKKFSFPFFFFLLWTFFVINNQNLYSQEPDCNEALASPPNYVYQNLFLPWFLQGDLATIEFLQPVEYGEDYCGTSNNTNDISIHYMPFNPLFFDEEDLPTVIENCLESPLNPEPWGTIVGQFNFETEVASPISSFIIEANPYAVCNKAPTFVWGGSSNDNILLLEDDLSNQFEVIDDIISSYETITGINKFMFRTNAFEPADIQDVIAITWTEVTTDLEDGIPGTMPTIGFNIVYNTFLPDHNYNEYYPLQEPSEPDKYFGHRALANHELMHAVGLAHVADPAISDGRIPLMFANQNLECPGSPDPCIKNVGVSNSECVKKAIRCIYGCEVEGDNGCQTATYGNIGIVTSTANMINTLGENIKVLKWGIETEGESGDLIGFNVYYKDNNGDAYKSLNKKIIVCELKSKTYRQMVVENHDAQSKKQYYLELVQAVGNRMIPFEDEGKQVNVNH